MTHCILIGAPVDAGQRVPGCMMGPSAYRVAGLGPVLQSLGHSVEDRGDVVRPPGRGEIHPNPAVHHLPEVLAWTEALAAAATTAMADGLPGDQASFEAARSYYYQSEYLIRTQWALSLKAQLQWG